MIKKGLVLLIITVLLWSCKSEFERVRVSGNIDLIYKKANELYDKGEYLKAQTLYELVVNNFRGKKEAEELHFRFANAHYQLKNYILAAYYFKNFSTTYPLSTLKEEADYMAAFSNFSMSPIHRLDQSYTNKAIEGFQDFINTWPKSARVAECNRLIDAMRQKLERKAFDEAKLYYDLREYQAALKSFENMLKDFPETKDNERIRYMMVEAAYSWASNSIRDKRTERYQKSLEYIEQFRRKYPKSKYSFNIDKTEEQTKSALAKL